MSKYINADEARLAITNLIRQIQMNDYSSDNGIPQLWNALKIISDIPSADVEEVRHGKWSRARLCNECSACKWGYVGLPETNYCPRCGAKMEVNKWAVTDTKDV